jgi:hypothetical protein
MTETPCAVAADTKVETPEGPLTIRSLASKAAPVMTRTPDGEVRFAMLKEVRKLEGARPVLRITLENGLSFRVAASQVLLKKSFVEARADALRAGDELQPLYSFPEGYVFRSDDGEERTSRGSLAVQAIAEDGEADVYSFRVNRTGVFALSAGVLGKAEGT